MIWMLLPVELLRQIIRAYVYYSQYKPLKKDKLTPVMQQHKKTEFRAKLHRPSQHI